MSMNTRLLRILAVLVLLLGTPAPVLAAEFREGETVTVGAGETVNDDLYAAAGTVQVLGTVNGDLIAAGGTITISGRVTGDVFVAGGTVIVSGQVGGSLRAAGGTISVEGRIGEDLVVGSGSAIVSGSGQVGRDLLAGAGSAQIMGPIGRNVWAGTGDLTIAGSVGGNIQAAADTLRFTERATVAGRVLYTSDRPAEIDVGARIAGPVERREPPEDQAAPEAGPVATALAWVRAVAGLFFLGLPLVLLFPGFSVRTADEIQRAPWASLGLGCGVLAVVPLVAALLFVVGLLIGGWWIAFFLLGLYLLALLLGFVIAGLFTGRWTVSLAHREGIALPWVYLLGLVLLGFVGVIPVLGGIAVFVALLFGTGALGLTLWSTYRNKGASEATP